MLQYCQTPLEHLRSELNLNSASSSVIEGEIQSGEICRMSSPLINTIFNSEPLIYRGTILSQFARIRPITQIAISGVNTLCFSVFSIGTVQNCTRIYQKYLPKTV